MEKGSWGGLWRVVYDQFHDLGEFLRVSQFSGLVSRDFVHYCNDFYLQQKVDKNSQIFVEIMTEVLLVLNAKCLSIQLFVQ